MQLKSAALISTVIAASAGALVSPGSAAIAAPSPVVPTAFALQSSGYGSRVVGGDVPAGSDRSAFQVINCTNSAGIDKSNAEADVDLGNGIGLDAVATHTWTTKNGGTVSTWSRETIAKVTLANTPAGSVALTGLSSLSHAWHDARGFHSKTTPSLASIVVTPLIGDPVVIQVPDAGATVRIPLVGVLKLGDGAAHHGADRATAFLDAVKLHLTLTDTTLYLAHSRAIIEGGVTQHLFQGSSYGTRVDVLEGAITSGPTPNLLMPCQGTAGDTIDNSTAHADLLDTVSADGLATSQQTSDNGPVTSAWEQADVASLNIGDDLTITAIEAHAYAQRKHGKLATNADGTTVGTITFQGEEVNLDVDGTLTIPGVATLERGVVNHISGGIEVTALRVTLLDGSLAVVNVGHAKVRISPSGL